MDAILALAGIVVRENLRKKVIHVFLVVAFFMLLWAGTLNVYNLGVQVKFLKDISLFAISIVGILVTLVTTAGQLSNEIQTRTIYPLLAKPVSRGQVLIGKFLGAFYIIFLNILILAVIFIGLLYKAQGFVDRETIQAIYLILLECSVTGAMCLFFSTFFSTAANVCITFILYLIGTLKYDYGEYLADKMDNPMVSLLVSVVQNPIFPANYEYFNIKTAIINEIQVGTGYMLSVSLYGLGIIVLYLLLANLVFLYRDL